MTLAFALGFSAAAAAAAAGAATVTVRVDGTVGHPAPMQLAAGARLSDALTRARVPNDAYTLGAAWLRPSLHMEQVRRKAGMLYDLDLLQAQARLDGNDALAAAAAALARRLRALPVTGRATQSLLDLRPLEVSGRNHLLADGDRIVFPPRPTHVRVVGAVKVPCARAFVSLRSADAYRRDCPANPAADSDWLYVIQPDGDVQRRGVAAWNRDPPQPLAPGAIVFVPLRESALPKGLRGVLNPEIARFLATQVLPGAAP